MTMGMRGSFRSPRGSVHRSGPLGVFGHGAHGFGCFGAAYYRDQTPRLELERALRHRGFALVDEPLFFVSFERRRPELPAEP